MVIFWTVCLSKIIIDVILCVDHPVIYLCWFSQIFQNEKKNPREQNVEQWKTLELGKKAKKKKTNDQLK